MINATLSAKFRVLFILFVLIITIITTTIISTTIIYTILYALCSTYSFSFTTRNLAKRSEEYCIEPLYIALSLILRCMFHH